MNVLKVSNIYNGGGVGIGDFNQDGLPDIYFTGNLVPNKLYLNKGDFKFEDITADSGADGKGNGAGVFRLSISIMMDGRISIYLLLSIRKGKNEKIYCTLIRAWIKTAFRILKKMAAEYGLADTSFSTMAAFFDYDNDGDLDMYLVVNEIVNSTIPNVFHKAGPGWFIPQQRKTYSETTGMIH